MTFGSQRELTQSEDNSGGNLGGLQGSLLSLEHGNNKSGDASDAHGNSVASITTTHVHESSVQSICASVHNMSVDSISSVSEQQLPASHPAQPNKPVPKHVLIIEDDVSVLLSSFSVSHCNAVVPVR
jgi:hypothetical protein